MSRIADTVRQLLDRARGSATARQGDLDLLHEELRAIGAEQEVPWAARERTWLLVQAANRQQEASQQEPAVPGPAVQPSPFFRSPVWARAAVAAVAIVALVGAIAGAGVREADEERASDQIALTPGSSHSVGTPTSGGPDRIDPRSPKTQSGGFVGSSETTAGSTAGPSQEEPVETTATVDQGPRVTGGTAREQSTLPSPSTSATRPPAVQVVPGSATTRPTAPTVPAPTTTQAPPPSISSTTTSTPPAPVFTQEEKEASARAVALRVAESVVQRDLTRASAVVSASGQSGLVQMAGSLTNPVGYELGSLSPAGSDPDSVRVVLVISDQVLPAAEAVPVSKRFLLAMKVSSESCLVTAIYAVPGG
jgi:hypothetical protein